MDPTGESLREHADGDAIPSRAWYATALSRRSATEDHGAQARRLLAVLRFLTRLRDSEREEELLRTVVQAAAVWYDVEAFAYRLDVAGRFRLDTCLPGADVSDHPSELPASIVPAVPGVPKLLSSIVEIEEVGWRETTGEIALTSVVYAGRPQWVIVISGRFSDEGVTAFAAVGQALGAVLQRGVDREAGEVCERLRQMLRDASTLESSLPSVGDLLVKYASAQAARLRVQPAEAATDDAGGEEAPAPGVERVHRVVPLPARRVLTLTLDSRAGAPFRPATLAVIDAAVACLQQRIETVVGQSATNAFETRVDEAIAQARRSGFGLGLALITMPETTATPAPTSGIVVDTIRSGLRGTDLIGNLRTGEIALVLVATEGDGAAVVGERIKRRLQSLVGGDQSPRIGIWRGTLSAGNQSASVLFAEARAEQALLMNTQ